MDAIIDNFYIYPSNHFIGRECIMFNLKDFVKCGLLKAVGNMADYQVILNAAGWLEKGVLNEADLAEIDDAIHVQYPIEEADGTSDEEA